MLCYLPHTRLATRLARLASLACLRSSFFSTPHSMSWKGKAPTPAVRHHSFDVASLVGPDASARMQTFVDRPSADGRRLHREVIELEPPSPVKRARLEAMNSSSGSRSRPAPRSLDAQVPDVLERYQMVADDLVVDGDDNPPLPDLLDLPSMPRAKMFQPGVSFSSTSPYLFANECAIAYRTRPWHAGITAYVTLTCGNCCAARAARMRARRYALAARRQGRRRYIAAWSVLGRSCFVRSVAFESMQTILCISFLYVCPQPSL